MYIISRNNIKPNPEHLYPLINLPVTKDISAMHHVLGTFAHYAHWIPTFSDKIHPLTIVLKFLLSHIAEKAFNKLKRGITKAAITPPNHILPLVAETDPSEFKTIGRAHSLFLQDPV